MNNEEKYLTSQDLSQSDQQKYKQVDDAVTQMNAKLGKPHGEIGENVSSGLYKDMKEANEKGTPIGAYPSINTDFVKAGERLMVEVARSPDGTPGDPANRIYSRASEDLVRTPAANNFAEIIQLDLEQQRQKSQQMAQDMSLDKPTQGTPAVGPRSNLG